MSLPNVVLTFVGAMLTTKIGPIKAICLYLGVLLVGQGMITFAVYTLCKSWYALALVGRMLVGISGYSLIGANLALIPRYTSQKLVPLSVGLGSMLPWTTESLTTLISPIIYSLCSKVYLPFFFAYKSCLVIVFCWSYTRRSQPDYWRI